MDRAIRRTARVGVLLSSSIAGILAVGACNNTLNFRAGGEGCGSPGSICSVGDHGVGDGGPALEASFAGPESVALDAAGNVYIADTLHNRIRRIAPDGTVSTIVGTGQDSQAFRPGRPGPETAVSAPISVAATPDGWTYWIDEGSCGLYGLSPTSGNAVIVAGGGCGGLPRFNFNACSQISTDSLGNLVITDGDNLRVRYWNRGSAVATVVGISAQPGEIVTIAGNGGGGATNGVPATSSGMYPCHALFGPDGSLYIAEADYLDNRVRRVDPSGTIDALAGYGGVDASNGDGGPATGAAVYYPQGLAVDGDLLFIADSDERIRVVNMSAQPATWAGLTIGTGHILTVAGDGSPRYLVVDTGNALQQGFRSASAPPVVDANGDLLVLDVGNDLLRRIDATTGEMTTVAGYGAGGAISTWMHLPHGIVALEDGSAVVATRSGRLVHVDPDGLPTHFAGSGDTVHGGDGGPATAAGFWGTGLARGPDGSIYVADDLNHRIRRIDTAGTIFTVAGDGDNGSNGDGGPAINAGFAGPHGVAVDALGNLVVIDEDRVRYVNLSQSSATVAGVTILPGNVETIAGGNGEGYDGDGGPALEARFDFNDGNDVTNGVVVDASAVYVADYRNNRIRSIDLDTGIVETLVGSGAADEDGVGAPVGLAMRDGWLYWSQRIGNVVRRIDLATGVVETVAGDGGTGDYGDGGAARLGQFVSPRGLAFRADGTLLVSDGSHRVRQVVP